MITYTGRHVTVTNDVAPALADIAVGLGRIPRFCGQTPKWYSVLSHVLTVASILPDHLAIYGLLHDAPEALMGDVPTPLKTEEAKALEANILMRILRDHALPRPTEDEQHVIHWADTTALAAEAHALEHVEANKLWPDYDPEVFRMTDWWFEDGRNFSTLNPERSIPLFEQAVGHYMQLRAGALQEQPA